MPAVHPKSALFHQKEEERLVDLQAPVAILCIEPVGRLRGGVLQAEAQSVQEASRVYERGKLQPSPRAVPGKGPARALALANPGDPLDVGAVGHAMAFFIRCKI